MTILQPTQSSSASTSVCSLSDFLYMFGWHKLPLQYLQMLTVQLLFIHIHVYGFEDKHLQLWSLITDFMSSDPSLFSVFCHPATVMEHMSSMKRNDVGHSC